MSRSALPTGVVRDERALGDPWTDDHGEHAVLHVRQVDDDTWVLRESPAATGEAPFMYLLRGADRAVLVDTGAIADPAEAPLAATVDSLVGSMPLVVAHSHGHNDHTAGDSQLASRPGTTVVAKARGAVREFFGLPDEPHGGGDVPLDLGGRELRVAWAPGHDDRSIVLVDPGRRLMLSGDTAYPGRLYVDDLPALRRTLDVMVDLVEQHDVETVLGGHVERDAAGRDLAPGRRARPSEAALPLGPADLRRLRDLAHATEPTRGVVPGSPMDLYVGNPPVALARLAVRGLLARFGAR